MRNLDIYKLLYKDDRFYQEVFVQQSYKAVFNKKKDIVLDIGACAGEFSFWIQGKTVYAIEPEIEYYNEMISNIEEFSFHNVKPFNIAISKESGDRMFNIRSRGGSALSDNGSVNVKTLSLADFIVINHIPFVDILKIDIEGNEEEVFSADSFKTVAPLIKCIIGEHLSAVGHIFKDNGFKQKSTVNNNLLFER